jgi:hypothetical protein
MTWKACFHVADTLNQCSRDPFFPIWMNYISRLWLSALGQVCCIRTAFSHIRTLYNPIYQSDRLRLGAYIGTCFQWLGLILVTLEDPTTNHLTSLNLDVVPWKRQPGSNHRWVFQTKHSFETLLCFKIGTSALLVYRQVPYQLRYSWSGSWMNSLPLKAQDQACTLEFSVFSSHEIQLRCICNHGCLLPRMNFECIHIEDASIAPYKPFNKS